MKMSKSAAARLCRCVAAKLPATSMTIGPVEDLESYVKADWWRQIFDASYLRTDGDVVDDTEITSAEIDASLALLDAHPDDRILDLCCGQGRHVLEPAQRGKRGSSLASG